MIGEDKRIRLLDEKDIPTKEPEELEVEQEVVQPTQEEVEYFARPNCKRCYGRGYVGTWGVANAKSIKNGDRAVCSCVLRAMYREMKEDKVRVLEGV